MTAHGRFASSVVAPGVVLGWLVTAMPAAAQAVDTSQWKCESCPFREGSRTETSVGTVYVDGANAASGRFTGLDEDEARLDGAVEGYWRGESGAFARYSASGIGMPTASGRALLGREGRYDVTLHYDAVPWRRFEITGTPFSGAASLGLPRDWVRAIGTGGMMRLGASLDDRDIGTDRNSYGLAARYLAGRRWTLFANWTQQERDGTAASYGAFLNSAVQLPVPIDHVTDDFEAGASWASERGALRVAYSGSVFRNRNTALTFQNPYLPVLPAAASGRLALAPDNDSHQFAIGGHWRLDFWDTLVSGSASVGRLQQDDALLPPSTAAGSLAPLASLDGRVEIANYALTLASQPLPGLALRGVARRDDRDDASPPLALAYVVTDTFPGGTDLTPRYDYERTRLEGSADYALSSWLRIGGTGIWDEVTRANQDVRKTVEDGGHLRARIRAGDALSATLKAGLLHREASGLDLAALAPGENPLLRKYNLANRDRWLQELALSWTAGESVTLALQGRTTKDAYRRSPLGLTDGRTSSLGTQLAWTISETLSVHGDASYQEVTSKQLGQARPAGADWEVQNDETFWSAGAGAEWQPAPKWRVRGDLRYSESAGDATLLAAGQRDAYPQARVTQGTARLALRYQATPALGVQARLAYSSLDEDDWLRDGVGPATVPNLLALGAVADRFDATFVGVSFEYRFGAPPPGSAEAEEDEED
ncbi:MAG: MtrB/PioB family decaheme-associated outer membrane protein [Steroidobacteraceae bacterium]|jgi:MtrB/PioB family decaheme-associated outer membrane protein|nr:MtrB/PioB family decaheme-associated outer membrane protein [Steroidobacteraceae bacterium]